MKVGDKIRCIDPGDFTHEIQAGQVYTIKRWWPDAPSLLDIEESDARHYQTYRFEPV